MGVAYLMYHNKRKKNTPIEGTVYGVKIDTTNTDPSTALTYIEDSVGFTPARGNDGTFSFGSWQDKFPFNQVKPCVLKLGQVQYYLNPNNFAQKADGSPSVITGTDGDVMIEIPKVYWKFEKIGTDLYIRYSDVKIDSGYKCFAHTRGAIEKDKLYIGAYLGSGVWGSVSGKAPSRGSLADLASMRNYFKSDSKYLGYSSITFYQYTLLQILYTIMFKDRNSQKALGTGQQNTNVTDTYKATGFENASGMYYGRTVNTRKAKFMGIEDIWGNSAYWVDGLYINSGFNVYTATDNFSSTGVGYTLQGSIPANVNSTFISNVVGTTELGFYPMAGGATSSTGYCDIAYITNTRYIHSVGGLSTDGSGIYFMESNSSETGTNTSYRLAYL